MFNLVHQKLNRITKKQIIWLYSVLGLLVYVDSFFNRMFFDDDSFILKNDYVHSWKYFFYYFTKDVTAGAGGLSNYYRPVLEFVFSVEWQLWRGWIVPYHLVNTGVHIADAILLFYLLERLIKIRWLSMVVSLVFLLHPIQTEAVTYVNSLGDSLSVLFMMIAFHKYLDYFKSHKFSFIIWAIMFYILGILSKETAIVLSALIFAADFLLLSDTKNYFIRAWETLKRTWAFFGVTLLYMILRATAINLDNTYNFYKTGNGEGLTSQQIAFANSFLVRIYTFFPVLLKQFQIMFAPVHLIYERGSAIVTHFSNPTTIAGGVLFLILIILAVWTMKKAPVFSFGIFWFFITLSPTTNILVPINGIMYEHWLYLPLVGIFISLGYLLWRLCENRPSLQRAISVLAILFLLALGVRSAVRNRDWKDPITFYSRTLALNPDDLKIIQNLGAEYAAAGQYQQSEIMIKRGLELMPDDNNFLYNLGNTYLKEQKYTQAISAYKQVITQDHGYSPAYQNLLTTYLTIKDYNATNSLLREWLATEDLTTEEKMNIYILLGKTEVQLNNIDQALLYLDEALLLDPHNAAVQDLIDKAHYLKENPKAK